MRVKIVFNDGLGVTAEKIYENSWAMLKGLERVIEVADEDTGYSIAIYPIDRVVYMENLEDVV